MIPDQRLNLLKFQAANRGITPSSLERMNRDGVDIRPDVSVMVSITIPELQAFLEAYEEKHNGRG